MNPGDPLSKEDQSNPELALLTGSGQQMKRPLPGRCHHQECVGYGTDTGDRCNSMSEHALTPQHNLSLVQQTGWREYALNGSLRAGCGAEMT